VTVDAGEVEHEERGKLGMGELVRMGQWWRKGCPVFLGANRSENTVFRQ
jgi:hypothetical protein